LGVRHNAIAALVTAVVLVFTCGVTAFAAPGSNTPPPGTTANAKVIATKLDIPWGLAVLPDGSALFTQRNTGEIMSLKQGAVKAEQKIEDSVPTGGEGGLLGLVTSPNYQSDKTLFIYYSTTVDNRIAKLRLGEKPQPILTGLKKNRIHNGGRLAFGPDGQLYATVGDAEDTNAAQDPKSLNGKILRMTPDGKPVPGNPFGDSLVYSLGHRNPQGLAWDEAGRLYAAEFGQDTWDEVNRIEPGKNYGWPICEGNCNDPRFANPLVTWSTAEASPSGMAIQHGQIYVAALRGQRLWQIPLNPDGAIGQPQALFVNQFGRLRTVVPASDGTLWVTTSNRDKNGKPTPDDDRILNITP
jgi:glucose/arabinose dehydrogenase